MSYNGNQLSFDAFGSHKADPVEAETGPAIDSPKIARIREERFQDLKAKGYYPGVGGVGVRTEIELVALEEQLEQPGSSTE